MLDLPNWLIAALPGIECPKCKIPIKRSQIIAIGMRLRTPKKKSKKISTAIYIEHECSGCKYYAILDLGEISMKEFVLDMVDSTLEPEDIIELLGEDDTEEQAPRLPEQEFDEIIYDETLGEQGDFDRNKSKNGDQNKGNSYIGKSKISNNEYNKAIKFVEKCKNHYEFMLGIGITPEEIEKYNKELIEEKKKNIKGKDHE